MSKGPIKKQTGFFDAEFRLQKLDTIGDPLQKLTSCIDWERFRVLLKHGFEKDVPSKGPGGRPPDDYVLRFKVLVIQSLYNLSDDALEFQLNDRRTFQRFIGLEDKDSIPDAKTIWSWRETLTQKGTFEKIFKKFGPLLEEKGIIANSGSLVDATFVDKPRQRNSRDENEEIKRGKPPEEWTKPGNEARLRQKDLDARWTKKKEETHYGYKNHVKVDAKTKLITKSVTTDAAVHDSQALQNLLDKTDEGKPIYADSAYVGEENAKKILKKKALPRIWEKGFRNHPLTLQQKTNNRNKARTRGRVEHVFGFMTMSMGRIWLRSVGITRARAHNTLKSLVYNMHRFYVLVKL